MNSNSIENEKTTDREVIHSSHCSQCNSMGLENAYPKLLGFGYIYIPRVLRALSWFILIVHVGLAPWLAIYYSKLDSYPVQNINP